MNFKDLQKQLKAMKGITNISLIRKNVVKLDLDKEVVVKDTTSLQKQKVLFTDLEDKDLLNKSIAEEIRGLAVEENIPIITSSQLNREGYTSSDPDLANTSESFGLPATADLLSLIHISEHTRPERIAGGVGGM